ncbi:MAG: biotin-[acetyl-CoA-carboxylase] ligase [Candidatus Xenolissoclinum pacificiensis L6]|uniref:Biotin-[acetyl-CoA-carboxylase] ligase n=1 Tax=Candidatus Xenolissoclinum pacificiensis L6 TaxID=1401685 RepID=W2V055_9RICK|nr:MAG: biotin-[acetyl-CoA-carboxylase] ligase [Candidatus Xenolissoclinum pacificiensis L6]
MSVVIRRYEIEETDSTQILAKKIINQNIYIDHVVSILAHKQRCGYGRKKQLFFSEGGMYFSIIIPKKHTKIPTWQYVYLVPIAIEKTLLSIGDFDISYKWPNDIMHESRKISGIIIECFLSCIIVGIGINIKPVPDFEYPTACIEEIVTGDIDKSDMVNIITSFILNTNLSWAEIRVKWLLKSFKLGDVVQIDRTTGTFIGIDIDTGSILLQVDSKIIDFKVGNMIV